LLRPGLSGVARADVREIGFCKRSVVALSSRQLRGVAYVCGQLPRDVLSGALQKTRRAAGTETFLRMSRRLAGTHVFLRRVSVMKSIEDRRASSVSAWRPLSSVVSDVLRDVRVVPLPANAVKSPQKLN
jgi:hypothetical protein